jgi:hypothetical protein
MRRSSVIAWLAVVIMVTLALLSLGGIVHAVTNAHATGWTSPLVSDHEWSSGYAHEGRLCGLARSFGCEAVMASL